MVVASRFVGGYLAQRPRNVTGKILSLVPNPEHLCIEMVSTVKNIVFRLLIQQPLMNMQAEIQRAGGGDQIQWTSLPSLLFSKSALHTSPICSLDTAPVSPRQVPQAAPREESYGVALDATFMSALYIASV